LGKKTRTRHSHNGFWRELKPPRMRGKKRKNAAREEINAAKGEKTNSAWRGDTISLKSRRKLPKKAEVRNKGGLLSEGRKKAPSIGEGVRNQ